MKKVILLLTFSLLTLSLSAQKPALDHSVYDGWKSLGRITVPNDGNVAFYNVSPQEGDGRLEIYLINTGKTYSIPRASAPILSKDATKLIFRIAPYFQQTRKAKIDKKKPNEMPKDSLGIMDLATGAISKYPYLKGFKASEEFNEYIAFQESEKPAPKKGHKETPKGGKAEESKDQTRAMMMMGGGAPAGPASDLYVLNIKTLQIDTIKSVTHYAFAKKGDKMVYITDPGKKDSITVKGIFMYEPANKLTTTLLTGVKKSTFSTNLSFNEEGTKLAFMANTDTTPDAKKLMNIYLYADGETKMFIAKDAAGLPKNWKISDNGRIRFHCNDSYITFGTCPIPREKDTTLVDFEQPKLDIWTWNEESLPTVQLANLQREKNRSYLAKAEIGTDNAKVIQLADILIPNVSISDDNCENVVIATTDKPYRIRQQWDSNPISDIYLISLKDGSRELLEKGATYYATSSSPNGKYYVSFDIKDKNWYLFNVLTGEKKDITSSLGVGFWNDDVDTPSAPRPYNFPVWSEDSRYFVLSDKYDCWQFDPTGAVAPFLLTEGVGRATKTKYSVGSPYYETKTMMFGGLNIKNDKPIFFTTFNEVTKETGFSYKDITKKKAKLTKMVEGPYTFSNFSISEGKKPVYIYTKANFEDGVNLWLTKDNFKTQVQLSDINPQQREYNWGTVELISWNTKKGRKAEGLLFKPENFDPSKKYPVLIYFYERNSETLYSSRVPAPSRSTINIPYFVSNEYLVFVPDIFYEVGHPGQSALDCILPGCDKLCENSWVDGENMAIQGQSWGGYQVAYMITQTNRFKAAGAGAPVSNMTSAYGGIRWESGVVRQFQYEQQQSRIGKNLWDGFDLYVENSPVFFVPNVTTPVLIMHNDADGAVPWWQGIEFFTSLKRCGKQAWMLQYNNEAHNLRERRNCKDLSIRLQQFFDHFLKGAPMPQWMEYGIPATMKGIDLGYDIK